MDKNIIFNYSMQNTSGLAEVKSRWGGTYKGAGEFGEGDISKE